MKGEGWHRVFAALLLALAIFAPQAVALGDAPPGRRTTVVPEIAAHDLPVEARATLALIDRGGPFPYERDGIVFRNYEKLLPLKDRGYYREYTVTTPGANHRGARRIVTGRGGEWYYTDDHYQSFRRIRR